MFGCSHQWRIQPDLELKGGGQFLFCLPCWLFSLLGFRLFLPKNKGRTPGSFVLKSSVVRRVDRYPLLTFQSILDRHPVQYSVDTLSALKQQSIDSRPSVYESIQNLVDSRPGCRWSDDRTSIEDIDGHSTADALNLNVEFIIIVPTNEAFKFPPVLNSSPNDEGTKQLPEGQSMRKCLFNFECRLNFISITRPRTALRLKL